MHSDEASLNPKPWPRAPAANRRPLPTGAGLVLLLDWTEWSHAQALCSPLGALRHHTLPHSRRAWAQGSQDGCSFRVLWSPGSWAERPGCRAVAQDSAQLLGRKTGGSSFSLRSACMPLGSPGTSLVFVKLFHLHSGPGHDLGTPPPLPGARPPSLLVLLFLFLRPRPSASSHFSDFPLAPPSHTPAPPTHCQLCAI